VVSSKEGGIIGTSITWGLEHVKITTLRLPIIRKRSIMCSEVFNESAGSPGYWWLTHNIIVICALWVNYLIH